MKTSLALALAWFAVIALAGCKQSRISPTIAPPPQRVTAISFLNSNQTEDSQFGLFSYLLFAEPATAANKDRYRAAILNYLSRYAEVSVVETYVGKHDLNVFYLPIRQDPTTQPSWESLSVDARADWLLDHYDYPRALAMLRVVPGRHQMGPYIVSYDAPLTQQTQTIDRDFLFQDLSAAPIGIFPAWFNVFTEQAAQPDFWHPDRVHQTVVNIRTVIENAATHVDDVKNAVMAWVTWGKGVIAATQH